jgi:uncharacterized SAM-binding protein YcdF (DUF218 family)
MSRPVASFFTTLVVIALFAWAGGLLWFASTIPTAVEDADTRTDAIVVLTGGSERIETGLALLSRGLADRLFVSGAGEQVKAGDILPRAATLPVELRDNITVGTVASDTPGNAVETAVWAKASNVHSIRLVTAAYHMRRSLLEFHTAMPDVAIVPHAVFPANVKTDWWRWPGTASLIAREYSKYVVTWMVQKVAAQDIAAGDLRQMHMAGLAFP